MVKFYITLCSEQLVELIFEIRTNLQDHIFEVQYIQEYSGHY